MGKKSRKKKEKKRRLGKTLKSIESKMAGKRAPTYSRDNDDGRLDKNGKNRRNNSKVLMMTMTGEAVQLARVYYDLHAPERIQRIFSTLRCMSNDRMRDRWEWLFSGETKNLKFRNSYSDIPLHRRPIVLGYLYSKQAGEMYLDVNSFERAEAAIPFFDKRIPRDVAEVTDVAVVNKLFESIDGRLPNPGDYFDNPSKVKKKDPDALMDDLKRKVASIENPMEKMRVAHSELMKSMGEPLPGVERIPTHYNEEGMTGLKGALMMRSAVAMQHWMGNTTYTTRDFQEKIEARMEKEGASLF